MRVLWAPWRMVYLTEEQPPGCIFCPAPDRDRREAFILAETSYVIIMLNRFPYASGHVLLAPRRHVGDTGALEPDEFVALTRALQSSIDVVRAEFKPQGLNVGMNLGRAAGAGIDAHIHWHIVPRWNGDTNFMPVFSDVRVMPEHLEATYARLHPRFAAMVSQL